MSSDVVCPFCGEGDFDLPGLSAHLYGGSAADCEKYREAHAEHNAWLTRLAAIRRGGKSGQETGEKKV